MAVLRLPLVMNNALVPLVHGTKVGDSLVHRGLEQPLANTQHEPRYVDFRVIFRRDLRNEILDNVLTIIELLNFC